MTTGMNRHWHVAATENHRAERGDDVWGSVAAPLSTLYVYMGARYPIVQYVCSWYTFAGPMIPARMRTRTSLERQHARAHLRSPPIIAGPVAAIARFRAMNLGSADNFASV
jgi:hypothetical protein